MTKVFRMSILKKINFIVTPEQINMQFGARDIEITGCRL
jgi:hypothetical protein